MATGGVGAVLEYLIKNGFDHAAAELRKDLAARAQLDASSGRVCAAEDEDDLCRLVKLPPMRTEIICPESSSSSDVFLSMASSPSDLANTYFFYGNSNKSSDAHSEFGMALDFGDPSDVSWHDWKDPYLMPTISAEAFGLEGSVVTDRGMDGSSEVNGYIVPLFDAYSERKELLYDEEYVGKQCLAGDIVALPKLADEDCGDGSWGTGSWGNLLDELQSSEEITNLDLRLHLPKIKTNADNGGELANTDGNCSFEFMEHEKSNEETHNHAIATDNRDDNGATSGPEIKDYKEDEYEIFDLRIVHRKNRTGFEASKDIPIILNSVTAGRYRVTGYLGSAAFSKVFQAYDLWTGVDVCLKIIKNNKNFFDQGLDEIKLLKFVNKHDPSDEHHILRLYDYLYHQEHLFIACELLKASLYEFQRYNQESGEEAYFTLPRIQSIAQQCLEALEYLHHLGIIHCDLKPENILIKSYRRCQIKIIDFGSSCFHSDKLCLYVQSRSYRAPEVILGIPYDQKIDIWSLGCIMAELFSGNVLFPNYSIETLLGLMIGILGPIDMEMLSLGQATHKYFTKDYDLYYKDEKTGQVKYAIPEISLACYLGNPDPLFLDFLLYLLQINPQRRPTAAAALQHPWLSHRYH